MSWDTSHNHDATVWGHYFCSTATHAENDSVGIFEDSIAGEIPDPPCPSINCS